MQRRSFLTGALAATAAGPALAANPRPDRSYKVISTEEAFTLPDIEAAATRVSAAANRGPSAINSAAAVREHFRTMSRDLGEARLRGMDEAGVDMQLLSIGSPGVQTLPTDEAVALSISANDQIAAVVARHPTRFAALATIAPQNPSAAVKELERAITQLKFNGAMINSHTSGEYLDLPKYRPILEAAQALDRPIYIHPREPAPGMAGPLDIPGFHVGWSYAVDVGTHILRMISAGVFDALPNLQIVIGHLGEMIPFYFDRLDNRYQWEWNFAGKPAPLKRKPSDYFHTNISVTTSGVNYADPLNYAIKRMGADRVMFAADYPYEDQDDSVAMARKAISDPAVALQLFQTNAQRIFKITGPIG